MKGHALLFSLALLVRLVFLWEMRDSVFFEVLLGDGQGYERFARLLLANGWTADDAFYQAPLYPYFLAAVHALFGPDLLAVRVLQALAGAASCVLLADAAGRFFERRTGTLSGCCLALYAPAVFYDVTIEKTALGLFFLTLFLNVLARSTASLTAARALALGASIGALSVLRENLIGLLAVVLAWAWLSFRGRRLKSIALCLAGLAAVQAPFVLHNFAVAGSLSASSHLGPNLYIGNSATADGLYVPLTPGRGSWEHEREDARTLAEARVGRALAPAEVSRHWAGRALRWAASNPLAWARLTVRKLHYTFHSREWMDSVSYDVVRGESAVLGLLGLPMRFGLLVPLAVVGSWLAWSSRPRPTLLFACIAMVTVSTALFFVFARYRFALVPLLIPFAARALSDVRTWIPARWKTGVALLVATWVVVHVPVAAREHPYADTYNNVAGALLDRGEPERALGILQAVVRRDPDYALPYLNLGQALIALGRLDQARDALESALARGTHHAGLVDLELGRAHALGGDYDTAQGHFEAARRRNPLLPEVHAGLGLLFARTGRPADAEAAYREALRLRPDYADVHNDLGYLLQLTGRFTEAGESYERALRHDPRHERALPNLAWLRSAAPPAVVRDGVQAVQLATRFLARLGDEHAGAQDLLAAARAESGDFEGALDDARRARELWRSDPSPIDARLAGYERGVPYRFGSAQRAAHER